MYTSNSSQPFCVQNQIGDPKCTDYNRRDIRNASWKRVLRKMFLSYAVIEDASV